nr:FadR/GntR family transcriptional regulator [Verminephrobacter eiseniae]
MQQKAGHVRPVQGLFSLDPQSAFPASAAHGGDTFPAVFLVHMGTFPWFIRQLLQTNPTGSIILIMQDSGVKCDDSVSNRTSGVTDAVIKLIHQDRLLPDDSLPSEGEFARRLGVGRGVVREAFKALEALGILNLAPGKRARVGRLKSHMLALLMDHAVVTMQVNVQQTLDLRRTLEMRTAWLAALRRSAAELTLIRQAAVAMRQHGTGHESPTEDDIAFHVAIARAAQNPLYALLIEGFRLVIWQTAPISWAARQSDEERSAVHDMHDAIVDAIARQDAGAAEAAMAAHFDNSVQALIAAGVT